MSRLPKLLLFSTLLVFALACNMVTQPFKDVQNVASTAQSLATDMPNMSTMQAVSTSMPELMSTMQAAATDLPDINSMFNPQGTPVDKWNEIPIMSTATAGQEFDKNNYSFKASSTVKDATDFYTKAMAELGWSTTVAVPGNDQGGVLLFSKGSSYLTITVTAKDDGIVVLLTLV